MTLGVVQSLYSLRETGIKTSELICDVQINAAFMGAVLTYKNDPLWTLWDKPCEGTVHTKCNAIVTYVLY